jgi:hypothetical protein
MIMKYFAAPLIALAFGLAATQAQAQDASSAHPDTSATPAQPATAPPPAAPAPEGAIPSQSAPDASAPAAQTAPPAAAAPAADASAQTTTTVSDAEVDQFAQATVKVQKINADIKLDESAKQKQMADAVKAAGMDPARFNEIGKAIATDSALRAKVQTAMAKYAGPAKG